MYRTDYSLAHHDVHRRANSPAHDRCPQKKVFVASTSGALSGLL
jgi:hypothetical protein